MIDIFLCYNKHMKIIKKISYLFLSIALLFSLFSCAKNTSVIKNNISQNISQFPEQGTYTSRDDVALYIHTYKKLPSNFITKSEARKLGWQVGNNNDLSKVAKGKSIGGDEFKNYEKLLPIVDGRKYYECDIDYVSGKRNPKRIVYAIDDDEDEDGNGNEEVHIYYTDDHYNSFTEIKFD